MAWCSFQVLWKFIIWLKQEHGTFCATNIKWKVKLWCWFIVMVRVLVACSKMQLPSFVLSSAMADSTTWYMMEMCWCYSLTLVSVEDLGLCDINCTTLAWGTVTAQCLEGHIICHGLTGYVSQWVACCLYVMMLSWYRRWQFESLLLWKLDISFHSFGKGMYEKFTIQIQSCRVPDGVGYRASSNVFCLPAVDE